jgi:hypothetical protein
MGAHLICSLALKAATLEKDLRKISLGILAAAIFLSGSGVFAQQLDMAFGVNALTSPAASLSTSGNTLASIGGGSYVGFSGDYLFLFNRQFGVGSEVFWRASRANYGGSQPYRPLFYDFNAVWAPRLGQRVSAELMAGIGAESLRFYTPFQTCSFVSCTNYVSSNHFMGDFGGGLRFYVHGGLFLRPEAKLYLVRNNQEFSSNHATRYGLSIGYSFGREQP